MSQLRRDIVTGEWIILAEERAKRPTNFKKKEATKEIPAWDQKCPFCPGNEHMTPPEIFVYRDPESALEKKDWQIRVIPNKFPALKRKGKPSYLKESIYEAMNGFGAHEVVIETPIHNKTICFLEKTQIAEIIKTYIRRYKALKKDPNIKYIQIFRNHGEEAGCSLVHAHSQIVATPVVPQKILNKIKGSNNYFKEKKRCVYCDIIQTELSLKKRIVAQNTHFVAFTPFASRSPFQVNIAPYNHCPCFCDIREKEILSFATILKEVRLRLYILLEDPPYNFTLFTAPVKGRDLTGFHWHMEIIPRLTTPAGFELGTSIYINTVSPEEAAQHLRGVKI